MPGLAHRRLFGPVALGAAAATVYTCPTNHAVIYEIRACNTTGAAVLLTYSLGLDAVGTRQVSGLSIPSGGVYVKHAMWELDSGELIQASGLGLTMTGWGEEVP